MDLRWALSCANLCDIVALEHFNVLVICFSAVNRTTDVINQTGVF
jgi:hypothetical protein